MGWLRKGYFDAEDSEEARYGKKTALNAQRLIDYQRGEYALGGGVADPLPEDAPFLSTAAWKSSVLMSGEAIYRGVPPLSRKEGKTSLRRNCVWKKN